MQLLCTPPPGGLPVPYEQMHSELPSLRATFEAWHLGGATSGRDALDMREYCLSARMLSSASLHLLYEIASQFVDDLPVHVYSHEASYSAVETQALLPKNVLVLKTVSVDMAGRLLLWTSVGEQRLSLGQRRAVAESLGLPLRAAKHCSINPLTCNPEKEFAMLPGMVSPFLPPFRPGRLAALVLVRWPSEWEGQDKEVAISLSLRESLVLPLRCFYVILRQYATRAYI